MVLGRTILREGSSSEGNTGESSLHRCLRGRRLNGGCHRRTTASEYPSSKGSLGDGSLHRARGKYPLLDLKSPLLDLGIAISNRPSGNRRNGLGKWGNGLEGKGGNGLDGEGSNRLGGKSSIEGSRGGDGRKRP